jgi:hypothetical protein
MSRLYYVIVIGLLGFSLTAQSGKDRKVVRNKYVPEITAQSLKSNLEVIASAEMQGRDTGSEGIKKAGSFITQAYQSWGIPFLQGQDSYYQSVYIERKYWDNAVMKLEVAEESYKLYWDYVLLHQYSQPITLDQAETVFVGYGIETASYNNYTGSNLKGKVAIVLEGEPKKADGTYLLTGTNESSEWSTDLSLKAKTAYKYGAALVLVIQEDLKEMINQNRRSIMGPKTIMGKVVEKPDMSKGNLALISSNLLNVLSGSDSLKVAEAISYTQQGAIVSSFTLPNKVSLHFAYRNSVIDCNNLLGFIEGSHPEKKKEIIVISAHYDHVGFKGDDIFYGADDNGSGTVAVMELAKVVAKAKKEGNGPDRSILFLLVTAEEKGLLGSGYYVENPVFPLESTIANLNIDMIGRIDDTYVDDPNYIYVIGSDKLSTELHEINIEANTEVTSQLKLDFKFNDDNDPNRFYFRSDHYNFAKNGIPALFYFNGVHADYHKTTDTVEKIHFGKMETITRFIFGVMWELANRPDRIIVDKA